MQRDTKLSRCTHSLLAGYGSRKSLIDHCSQWIVLSYKILSCIATAEDTVLFGEEIWLVRQAHPSSFQSQLTTALGEAGILSTPHSPGKSTHHCSFQSMILALFTSHNWASSISSPSTNYEPSQILPSTITVFILQYHSFHNGRTSPRSKKGFTFPGTDP